MVLRSFRDTFLLTSRPGSAFVNWYYATSPAIADTIQKSEALEGGRPHNAYPRHRLRLPLPYPGCSTHLVPYHPDVYHSRLDGQTYRGLIYRAGRSAVQYYTVIESVEVSF